MGRITFEDENVAIEVAIDRLNASQGTIAKTKAVFANKVFSLCVEHRQRSESPEKKLRQNTSLMRVIYSLWCLETKRPQPAYLSGLRAFNESPTVKGIRP